MPGNTPSTNSTTVTSAPRRRHTEPSSRPMTPAPTTSRCCGTCSSASAPVGRHHALLVDGDAFELADIRAGGDNDRLGVERLRLAVVAFDLDLADSGYAPGAKEGIDLIFLEQKLERLWTLPVDRPGP